MKLNAERKPLYSRLTHGRSEKISDALLAMEARMLRSQNIFQYDRWSEKYEALGIPVSCQAVVPMANTPGFTGFFANGSVPFGQKKSQVRVSDIPRLMTAFTLRRDAKFFAITQEILSRLNTEPRLDCLYRHFIESMARISALQPVHEAAAAQVGLRSPRWIQRQMIFGHLASLPSVLKIDHQARELNAAGVSIVCGDIPHIPLP